MYKAVSIEAMFLPTGNRKELLFFFGSSGYFKAKDNYCALINDEMTKESFSFPLELSKFTAISESTSNKAQ